MPVDKYGVPNDFEEFEALNATFTDIQWKRSGSSQTQKPIDCSLTQDIAAWDKSYLSVSYQNAM